MSLEARQFLENLQRQDYEQNDTPHWLKKEKGALINEQLEALLKLRQTIQQDIASPEEYGAFWQILFPGQSGIEKVPAHQLEALSDASFARKLEQLARAPLPTRLEDPFTYSVFSLVYPFLERGFRHFGYQPDAITVGTRPHPEVNAQVFRIPESQSYLIALQEGLVAFLFKAARVFNKFTTPPHQFFDTWSMRPEIEQNHILPPQSKIKLDATADFIDILQVFLFGRSDEYDDHLFAPKDISISLNINTTLTLPMYTFVFAHEYAHVFLNHQLGEKDWQKETEADLKALQMALIAFKDNEKAFPVLNAVALYFELIEILEMAKSVMITGEPYRMRSDSHPYPKIRKAALFNALAEQLKTDPVDYKMAAFSQQVTSQFAIEMWLKIHPKLQEWKAAGLQMKSFLNLQKISSL